MNDRSSRARAGWVQPVACAVAASAVGVVAVMLYGLAQGHAAVGKALFVGLLVQWCVFMLVALPVALFVVVPLLALVARRIRPGFALSALVAFVAAFGTLAAVTALISQGRALDTLLVPLAIGSLAGALPLAACRSAQHRAVD